MATKRRSCAKATKPVAKRPATKKPAAKKTATKKPAATRKPKDKKFLVTTDAAGNIKTVKTV